jgi:hypothetical protein
MQHNYSDDLHRSFHNLPRSFRNGDDRAIHAALGDLVNGSVRCRSQAFEAFVGSSCLAQRFKKNLWLNAYKVCARKKLGLDVNESDIGAEEKSLWRNLQGTA